MAGLLVSKEPARGKTRLADWLEKNKDRVGAKYASEIKKHYEPIVIANTMSLSRFFEKPED
jgi:hypothetical protein